jgi:anti-sigma factor RsiW
MARRWPARKWESAQVSEGRNEPVTSDELTCQELVEIITDYLEGALPPHERTRFEEHLSDCGGCANYFSQMRRTIATLGALSEDTLEPGARDDLLQLFHDWKRTEATN